MSFLDNTFKILTDCVSILFSIKIFDNITIGSLFLGFSSLACIFFVIYCLRK